MEERIDIQEMDRDEKGDVKNFVVFFGPHHFIRIWAEKGKTKFKMGTTHHGIKADASQVPSELEKFINEIREKHPRNGIDSI